MQPNDGLLKTGLLVCWMAIAGLAVTYPAWAQTTNPAPAPGDTGTKKPAIKKLQIRPVDDLRFGRFIADNLLGGQIIIDPVTGNKKMVGAFNAGGDHSRAEYQITGEPNKKFVVTLPAHGFNLDAKQTGPQVERFSVYIVNSGSPVTNDNTQGIHPGPRQTVIGQLGPDGRATLFVGGTLVARPKLGSKTFNRSTDIFVDYLP